MQQRDENTQVSEEILPPDASRSGQNATYVPCDIRNARQNYGVCLHIIKAFKKTGLVSLVPTVPGPSIEMSAPL